MAPITRRAFLALTALLGAVVRVRALAGLARQSTPAPAAISVDEFLVLSRRLVGRTTLDAQVAGTYLKALLAVPANIPLLARLARNAGAALTPAHVALEQTIIEWWYTGVYTLGGERRVATHSGALLWSAIGVRAPGTCASAFGAWSRPPRPEA